MSLGRMYRTGVAIVVALASLVAGGALMQGAATAQETSSFDRDQLRRVVQLIERRYVEKVPAQRLYRLAIDGMLEELGDPHSRLIDADASTDLEITMTGNYGGLGIRVQQVGGWVTVMSVLPGTPAERQGLLPGDRIVGVDGQSVAGWEQTRVIESLRGPIGVPVTVSVARSGRLEPIDLTVTRDSIHVPPLLSYYLGDDVGVVRLMQFSREARDELRRAIEALIDEGATRLVLDLRGNPGGLLEEGVAVADLFLPAGATVVSTASRLEALNQTFRAEGEPAFPDIPMAVLVDGATASASEIVAGALQDHDRALIVGTRTFGKGSMQTVYALPGGRHLKLTTAHWYTPSGRSIQRERGPDGRLVVPVDVAGSVVTDSVVIIESSGAASDTAGREVFHTAAGRPVYGGGGIVPDVIVRDSLTEAERRLDAELTEQSLSIRQLAFRFAVAWVAEHPDMSRDFEITTAMRGRFRDLLRQEDVELDDETYAEVRPLIDGFLAVQLANTAFGELEALRREHRGDVQFERAVVRLRAAESAEDLLDPAALDPAAEASLDPAVPASPSD